MKGFYHIWALRPSWSCDLDFLNTHWFPLPIDASYKIWLWLAKRFQRRRSLKLWTDGRRTDGRTPDHGHPISSPCEPNGSGELIMHQSFVTIAPPPTGKGGDYDFQCPAKSPPPRGKLEVKTLLFAPPFTIENLSGVRILISNPVIFPALLGHLKCNCLAL